MRACATHAVLSGPAVERIENSEIEEVIVTNSIPLRGPGGQLPADQAAFGGAAAGQGDSVDPRGWFGKHVICLEKAVAVVRKDTMRKDITIAAEPRDVAREE